MTVATAVPKSAAPPSVSIDPLIHVLVWTIVFVILPGVNADPDLWGHLRFGTDVIRDWHLPTIDPYSFTSDIPWINHEWLSETTMAAAFAAGGSVGLSILRLLLAGCAAVVLARRLRNVPAIVQAPIILVVAWASPPMVSTMRPQLFSYALVALLAAVLTQPRPRRALFLVPIMFAAWVNLHGGWIVGLAVLGIWCACRLRDREWRWWAIGIGTATLLATLINPYGLGLWEFVFRTVGLQRDIREWRPLTAAPFGDWWPWILTLSAAISLEAIHRPRSLVRALTLALLAYASFRVVRLIPFFTLTAAIYLAPVFSALLQSRRRALALCAPSLPAASLAAFPVVLLLGLNVSDIKQRWTCIPVQGDWVPDRVTAMALQDAKPTGRLVTTFGWGQYAIWHFGPALRVSLDGRRETVYSPTWMEELWGMEAALPESLSLYAKLRPEYVWLPATGTGLVRTWLQDHGYRIDVEGDGAWLATRDDLPVVASSNRRASACFPG